MEYLGFKRLKVSSAEWVSPTTKRLVFSSSSTSGSDVPSQEVEVGTALLTFHTKPGAFFPTLRPYTPLSGTFSSGNLELLIRQVPNGAASPYMCSLKPGDELLARSISRYTWTPNIYNRIGLVAGGTGITPCMQLMRGILTNPNDRTNINLVYGCRQEKEAKGSGIPLKEEIDGLMKEYPGRVRTMYLTTPATDSSKSGAPSEGDDGDGQAKQSTAGGEVLTGRITKEILQKGLPPSSENTKIFVSGPPAMEEMVAGRNGILTQLGFGKKMIQKF